MKPRYSPRLLLLAVVLSALLVPACAKKRPTGVVRGKVSYGSKLVAGNVRFVAEDGAVGEGVIYNDGTYEVMEAPTGKCKVAVVTEHLRKKNTSMPMAPGGGMGGPGGPGGMPGRPGAGPKVPADAGKAGAAPPKGLETAGDSNRAPNGKYEPIPAKYENPETSGFTFDVQLGENSFDIPLK